MSDHTQVAKIMSDIVAHMSTSPLEWYVQNTRRLSSIMNQPYENVHRLILTMRNQ